MSLSPNYPHLKFDLVQRSFVFFNFINEVDGLLFFWSLLIIWTGSLIFVFPIKPFTSVVGIIVIYIGTAFGIFVFIIDLVVLINQHCCKKIFYNPKKFYKSKNERRNS